MMNKQDNVEYVKAFSNEILHSSIVNNHSKIESWFRRQWLKYPPPFYTSIDIRNSGFKIAPVDKWGISRYFEIKFACVPFPAPGGPKKINIIDLSSSYFYPTF